MQPLFTYGTLRIRQPNHHLVKDAPLVHQACRTVHKFLMLTQLSKSYPFIIPPEYWPEQAHNATHIVGDVFHITKEQQGFCDRLEGHPTCYQRTQISFHVSNAIIPAEAYILTESAFKEMDLTRIVLIKSGDWLKK